MTTAARIAEFLEGFGFDLADTLTGHAEMPPDFFERLLAAVEEVMPSVGGNETIEAQR